MYNADKIIYEVITSLNYECVNGYPTKIEDKDTFPIIGFTLDSLSSEVKSITNNRTMMYRNNYTIDIFDTNDTATNEISNALEEAGFTLTLYRQLPTELPNINHYVLHFTALVEQS